MILVQNIVLSWNKSCRGGKGAVKRSSFSQAAKLPANFFDYISFGSPVHWVWIQQRADGFHTLVNRRVIEEFDMQNSLRISPMELIPKENDSCEVRYRYDWHKGAIPERYQYHREKGRILLNELAFELRPFDYGRSICNGRFIDWDTGIWWYEWSIANIMVLPDQKAPLDSFLANTPTHYYRQMAQLW